MWLTLQAAVICYPSFNHKFDKYRIPCSINYLKNMCASSHHNHDPIVFNVQFNHYNYLAISSIIQTSISIQNFTEYWKKINFLNNSSPVAMPIVVRFHYIQPREIISCWMRKHCFEQIESSFLWAKIKLREKHMHWNACVNDILNRLDAQDRTNCNEAVSIPFVNKSIDT